MSTSGDSDESLKPSSKPTLLGRRVLLGLIKPSGEVDEESLVPLTDVTLNFDDDSYMSTDSTGILQADGTIGTSITTEVTFDGPIDRETFKLLTGRYPDDPVPKPRVTFTNGTHTLEATLDNELYHPDRHYKHEYQFTDVVYLCGPHDAEGNHIGE
jgi:hypothetical protein